MPPRCNLCEERQNLCILTGSWTQVKMYVIVSSQSFHTLFLFSYMELGSTPKASGSFIVHHIEKITSIPCGKHLGKHHCPFWKNRNSHPMYFFYHLQFFENKYEYLFQTKFHVLVWNHELFFSICIQSALNRSKGMWVVVSNTPLLQFLHSRLHFATFKCMWCSFHPQKVVIKMTNLIVV